VGEVNGVVGAGPVGVAGGMDGESEVIVSLKIPASETRCGHWLCDLR